MRFAVPLEPISGPTEVFTTSLREKLGSLTEKPWRFLSAALLVTVIAVGTLWATLWSQASSPRFTLGGAAGVACNGYIDQVLAANLSANPSAATVVDAYPTTAGNLEAWLKNFDPFAVPAVIQKLSTTSDVTACVLQDGGAMGSTRASYGVVMIAPDGTASPIASGPSEIFTAAPPAVGSR